MDETFLSWPQTPSLYPITIIRSTHTHTHTFSLKFPQSLEKTALIFGPSLGPGTFFSPGLLVSLRC